MAHDMEPDWDLLATYLSGEATAEEADAVETWVKDDPARQTLVDELRRSWAIPDEEFDASLDLATAKRHIHDRIRVAATGVHPINSTIADTPRVRDAVHVAPPRRFTRGRAAGIVGAIAAAFVVAIPTWHFLLSGRQSGQTTTYVTHRGEQITVTLADGSRVMLAPETRIRYTVDRMGARTIDLVGEAFFDVASRARQPFVVQTGAVVTRVLGTAFNVRRYVTDASTQVVVVSGRVTTGGRIAPTVLSAGSIARVTDSTTTVNTTPDPASAASWTRGMLVFNDTPVPVVLATLSRWYGYEFRLADSTLINQAISAEFQTDHVAGTMNTLKVVLGVTMTFNGNVVTLHPSHERSTTRQRSGKRTQFSNPEPEVGK